MKNETLLTFIVTGEDELERLFGLKNPLKGHKIIAFDGFELQIQNIIPKLGLGATEIIFEVTYNIGLGVSSSLVASWLFEKLTKNGQREVIHKTKRRILIKEKDFEILIEEEIEEMKK